MLHRRKKWERIQWLAIPDSRFSSEFVQQRHPLRSPTLRNGIMSRIDREGSALRVEDVRKDVPCAKSRHFAAIRSLAIQPFQKCNVAIELLVIAVDGWVRKAAESFVITRVAEVHSIGDVSLGPNGAVAVNLALLCDDVPEKRHESLAPGAR